MAKPQFSITLGRSGQRVVKDPWGGSDGISASASAPSLSKRSMPESFGGIGDHAFNNSKRMRNDMSGRSYGYSNPLDGNDSRLDPKDLRSKLTQKRISREMELEKHERKKMELYEKVSKAIRSVEPPNDDKLLRSTPSSREAIETPKVGSIISPFASWPSNEPPDHKPYRITPSSREASEAPKVCNTLSPFASWSSNEAGTRFSERIPRSSSGISTPWSAIDELPQPSPLRPVNRIEGWTTTPLGSSRPTVSMPTGSGHPDSGKLVTEFPPAAGGMSLPPLQSLHAPKESQHLTVSSLLHSLGLGKYYINFQAEEIDMAVLKQMGEGDLKELGIPMGPRKKIFLAVQERTKRPVTQPPSNYSLNS